MRIEQNDCIGGSSRSLGRELKDCLRGPRTVLLMEGPLVMRAVVLMSQCKSLDDVDQGESFVIA